MFLIVFLAIAIFDTSYLGTFLLFFLLKIVSLINSEEEGAYIVLLVSISLDCLCI